MSLSCAWSLLRRIAAPLAALALVGCADPPAPPSSPAEPAVHELTREAAITEARRDAAVRFQLRAPSAVLVNRVGHYWVVDLVAPEGGRLHYAIALDGMIRERRVDR